MGIIIAGVVVVGLVIIAGFAAKWPRVVTLSTAGVGLAGAVVLSMVTVVPAGHVGVIDVFGNVRERPVLPGVHLVNPVARVVKLSTRTQEITETAQVPSSEGLVMRLDVTMLFNLEAASAPEVYKTVGKEYREVLLIPQLRSYLRGATASFEAKALYTSGRDLVADAMEADLVPSLSERGFDNVQVLLREITLPAQVSQAIEEKLQAEQQSEKMRFVLDREKQEAERKRIEAQGIADFQAIVTEGISDKLLRWKGIEATEALAASSNAKVVVIGGSDGLPLILNNN